MIKKEDSIAIGWCDNGLTEGMFSHGLAETALHGRMSEMNITHILRVGGNQLPRQRQDLFNVWADTAKTDWLLWVDSDIVLNLEILTKLLIAADEKNRPVVSGIYFIDRSGTFKTPTPTIFYDKGEYDIQPIHPLPHDKIIKVDICGMGLMLMHKSVIEKLRTTINEQSFFNEVGKSNGSFIGEDVTFCRNLKKANVEIFATTSAIATHIKKINIDEEFYLRQYNESIL
jgi:GT2 family glycosyltransferase